MLIKMKVRVWIRFTQERYGRPGYTVGQGQRHAENRYHWSTQLVQDKLEIHVAQSPIVHLQTVETMSGKWEIILQHMVTKKEFILFFKHIQNTQCKC